MKAKKLIGSIALTAALAMGTMPAFAAPGLTQWDATANSMGNVGLAETAVSTENKLVSVNNTNDPKNGSGTTQIFASVYDADINVTVPVAMAVAFGNYGVTKLMLPSNYVITNNSPDHPVQLVSVQGKPNSTFELSKTQLTTTTGTKNQLFINLGQDFGSTANDGTFTPVGLSADVAHPTSSIVMDNPNYQYQWTFGDSVAAIGSTLGVGYIDSAVAGMTVTFDQVKVAS